MSQTPSEFLLQEFGEFEHEAQLSCWMKKASACETWIAAAFETLPKNSLAQSAESQACMDMPKYKKELFLDLYKKLWRKSPP